MYTFLQFLQLLVALGPQFATVWRLIMALVSELNGNQVRGCVYASVSPVEQTHLDELHKLASANGLNAAAFSIQDLLKVWQFIQQHPELMAAIKAIIDAFTKLRPSPQPAPNPAPTPTPPASI